MELNEIMTNEEVVETATEEIVEAASGSGLKVAAGFGIGILAGVAISKLAKPVIAKIKARREKAQAEEPEVVADADYVEKETKESKDE